MKEVIGSNNTNKLSPQEPSMSHFPLWLCSNNTNKLSPQELVAVLGVTTSVQIIQINLVLKNKLYLAACTSTFK